MARRKKPKQFKYDDRKYRIVEQNVPGYCGLVTFTPPIITICPETNETIEDYRQTLFHEILHIILWKCRQNQNEQVRIREETLVGYLERELFVAKSQNRSLFKFLFG